ncbi:hypothetical protein F5X96DRAFT_623929 [Biscogniauxia mediterranea]|nr:hypothetical protein F5X96DRAFT_623929 [Biscogniauxia mediterranea]
MVVQCLKISGVCACNINKDEGVVVYSSIAVRKRTTLSSQSRRRATALFARWVCIVPCWPLVPPDLIAVKGVGYPPIWHLQSFSVLFTYCGILFLPIRSRSWT